MKKRGGEPGPFDRDGDPLRVPDSDGSSSLRPWGQAARARKEGRAPRRREAARAVIAWGVGLVRRVR